MEEGARSGRERGKKGGRARQAGEVEREGGRREKGREGVREGERGREGGEERESSASEPTPRATHQHNGGNEKRGREREVFRC